MFSKSNPIGKIKHIIPLIPVYFVIISVSYSFTKYIYFNYNINTYLYEEHSAGSYLYLPFLYVVFYTCAIMTVVTHTRAMTTHPGTVSEDFIRQNRDLRNNYCKKCSIPRPDRAHHCKVCDICILKFDHHCPWIANCVGVRNQKLFFQFLFYSTLGDFVAFILLLGKALTIKLEPEKGIKGTYAALASMSDKFMLIIGTILSIAMVMSIGFLLVVQFGIIVNNKTTVESLKIGEGKTPYYDENKFNSFRLVMGFSWIEWFIPIVKLNKYNSGYTYGKLDDVIDPIYFNKYEIPNISASRQQDYIDLESDNMASNIA